MSEPIRVLHVVSSMGMGGIQTYLMSLYRAIDREKVQFDFLIHIPTEGGFEDEIQQMGGKIFYQPKLTGKNLIPYEKKFRIFLQKHPEYQIVHIHIRSAVVACAWGAKTERRCVVAHSHSTTNGYGCAAVIKNIAQFPVRYLGDYFMGCSQIANEWMFGKRVANSDKCRVIYNGIDISRFRFSTEMRKQKRAELGIAENEQLIGNVGRLVEQKNQELLIRAFALAYEKNPSLRLAIAGDGPLAQHLHELAKELDREKEILFLGNRKDVPELLQAFDVFVMPSKNEGLGIAAVEAQAAGLPCVVSEAVPEEALVVKQIVRCCGNSPEKWAAAIREVKEGRFENGEKAVRDAGYDIHIVAKELSDFYLEKAKEGVSKN